MDNFKNADFIDDKEKMNDFFILSKEEFLKSYSYLTEQEYNNTQRRFKPPLVYIIVIAIITNTIAIGFNIYQFILNIKLSSACLLKSC